ncbi:MAG: CBS domain-containing protein [Thermodesulfobacteriota bacterium]
MDKLHQTPGSTLTVEPTDEDILEAMKAFHGYLDITPADLKEIYSKIYQQALERIFRKIKAQDIMTQEVFLVHPDTPVKEVARLMSEKMVSGVPVVDRQGKVTGMVSETDFLKALSGEETTLKNMMGLVARCFASEKETTLKLLNITAGDIMSSPAIAVHTESTLKEIIELFSCHRINRAPVIDPANRLAGIVSRADVIKTQW